jgi:hypothetical protein
MSDRAHFLTEAGALGCGRQAGTFTRTSSGVRDFLSRLNSERCVRCSRVAEKERDRVGRSTPHAFAVGERAVWRGCPELVTVVEAFPWLDGQRSHLYAIVVDRPPTVYDRPGRRNAFEDDLRKVVEP